MNEKPIPEFMKEYMEHIGPECFLEYQSLSKEYYNTRQAFHEKKFPNYIPTGRSKVDVEAEMRRIDIQFKERSLDIGCKHGYEVPEPEQYDSPYTDQIDKDDFGILPEDKQAMRAHKAFEEKFPEKEPDRETNRETVEYFFGDGSYMPPPKPEPQKEAVSREELVTRFSLNRDDMLQPDSPSLSREERSRTQERDDREMDMER